jgi:hypothetical protein
MDLSEARQKELHEEIISSLRGWVGEGEGCDIRLQIWSDGSWAMHTRPSDYDLDHRGYWGASWLVPKPTEDDLVSLADALIDQALDHMAQQEE